MADRFQNLSICKGSPYESKIYWTSGLTPSWVGCHANTYSDHTALTEFGWWELRARAEWTLRGWLGVLPWLITTDAQAKSLDEFVRRRYDGKVQWIEGDAAKCAKPTASSQGDCVYRNAYSMVLLDPAIDLPDPALVKQFATGLARATKNFRAIFPDMAGRLQRKKASAHFAWRTYSNYPVAHVDPPRTAEMDAALRDMKIRYEDIYGQNPKWTTEANKYWSSAYALLNVDVLGCPYQVADARSGCDMQSAPFSVGDLYFLDMSFVIYPKPKMVAFLDLFAPGWQAGMRAPAFMDDLAKLKFDFGKPAAKKGLSGDESGSSMGLLAAGAVGLAAIGYLALRGKT